MKLLLNKEALQSNIWDSAISYFKRVLDQVEIISINDANHKYSCLHRLQYSVESKFAGKVTDKESVFDKRLDVSTENIVLNLSYRDKEDILTLYPDNELWAIEYQGKNISFFENCGIGFDEIVRHSETIRVDLVKYTRTNKRIIVDSAFYNPHYSAYRNFQKLLATMPRVFVRSINSDPIPQNIYAESILSEKHSFFRYCFLFYRSVFSKYAAVIINKLFGFYDERWTVAIGNGSVKKSGLTGLMVQEMPKHEFWADPFLFYKDNRLFLFFERFPFDKKKGVISVGEVVSGRVLNVRDILDKPYHLSYPNVFEEGGEYFMIPECSANKRVEIYKCIEFPDKWELYSTGFEGESLVDACYFKDSNGQQWLMASCSWNGVDTHNEALNIYQIDSLKLKQITPHSKNPVIVDSRKGRNGGRIYLEDGVTIRVAQDNRYGKYGHGVSLQAIDELSSDFYIEHSIASIEGQRIDGFSGTHQMCQDVQSFVLDLRR